MKISNVEWSKDLKGKWNFRSSCDGEDRKSTKGYLVIGSPNRIYGYCPEGKEEVWKKKLLDDYIKNLEDEKAKIDEVITEIKTLKESKQCL